MNWAKITHVRSKALLRRRVRLEDRQLDSASLCPFFDQVGRTRWIMLLSEEPEIRFFAIAETPVRIPLWGTIDVGRSWSHLPKLKPADLSGLWHFDPEWLLHQPQYVLHPLTPAIKATNCVERFKEGAGASMWYLRDLSKAYYVVIKNKNEYTSTRFKEKLLPTPPRFAATPAEVESPGRPRHGRSSWKLVPFWEA